MIEETMLEKKVLQMILRKTGLETIEIETIDYSAPIFASYDSENTGLELDSIDSLEIILGLKEEFGVVFESDDMYAFESITALAAYISEKIASKEKINE